MISGFQVALKNTIDVIAPPATPLQDFTYHWKQMMNFYASHQTDYKLPIEGTAIPRHLDRLVEILLDEEKKDDNPGPCLEYLIQHKLLDWLTTLASVETPPGMRFVCLSFLKRFLARSKFPLLHQAAVYGPVQKMISLCSGRIPSPIETEEVQFLLTICFLVCKYPHITSIINDSSSNRANSADSQNDFGGADKHSVTYVPFRKRNSVNMLFEPLNTQAVTIINTNLFACDHQRRRSICGGSKKSVKQGVDILSKSKDISKSNESSKNSSACSSPGFEKPNHDFTPPERITDRQDCDSCDQHSKSSSNNVDIKDLDDVRISMDCRGSGALAHNSRNFKAQSLSALPVGDRSSSLLLNALISYLNSADNNVRIRACEGIMVLGSLDDPSFARIMSQSELPQVVTSRLENLFKAIPAHVNPSEIEDIEVTWGLDSPLWTNENKFPGCRQVASYFMWLDYCNQLIKEAHPDVAHSLAKSIRHGFFEKIVTPALSDHHVVLITSIITETLKKVSSSVLNREISYWLVGEQRDPVIADICAYSVLERLIENCYIDSEDLTLETLKLFQEILDKRNEHILHCMVLSFLNSRGYYDNTAADSAIASWSDEEDEREREKKGSLDFSVEQSHSRTLAPSNIHRIINCFLLLMPRQLQTDPGEDNYERYMTDWEKQYERVKIDCAHFAWPLEAITVDDSGSYDSRPEADHCSSRFYVGPFLSMLLDKVSNIPSQKYEINLQLTVVISKLALFPHPYLHEFLLNPLLPLTPGTKNLFGCLQKTIKHLASEVTKMPKYKEVLIKTRRKLLEDHKLLMNENLLHESVVIVEEFCKELAAIAYVKYQHSI